jgi:AcrR family transcriptional regulator
MTNSDLRAGKRDRLIDAARDTFYRQGVEATTLADIAGSADVPLGNVYYYFKTKADLIAAVIGSHESDIRALLDAVEAGHGTPGERLKALFAALTARGDLAARYGCPHGSLCAELGKHGTDEAAVLIRAPVGWAERQFREMGRADARDLAIQVIAAYQGAALLSSALRDPDLLGRESARMAAWIDSLA